MSVFIWKRKNSKNKDKTENKNFKYILSFNGTKETVHIKIKNQFKIFLKNFKFLKPKVKNTQVIIFTRQFSTMINAGLPLISCLEILYNQQNNPTFKQTIKKIKNFVETGETLEDSFKKFPDIFNEFFVNMISAGEKGGILDIILARVAAYMEKMAKLKKKIKGAMIYPAITMVVALIVIGIILVFVIPVFSEMFQEFGGALPISTLFVIELSNFIVNKIEYIIVLFAFIIFLINKICSTQKGKIVIDIFILKLPVLGILMKKIAIAKFTRTMSTMMASGVSILEALNIVAKISGNKSVEFAIIDVKQEISSGHSMADSLIKTGVFPSMVCSMVAVGESTGKLDIMLGKIADFYEEEVEQAVKNSVDMIEPFLLIFIGLIIGWLIIAMYLPIFKMAGTIG